MYIYYIYSYPQIDGQVNPYYNLMVIKTVPSIWGWLYIYIYLSMVVPQPYISGPIMVITLWFKLVNSGEILIHGRDHHLMVPSIDYGVMMDLMWDDFELSESTTLVPSHRCWNVVGYFWPCPWKGAYERKLYRFWIPWRIHVWHIWFAIYHQYTPNVSIYTIHGSYGNRIGISSEWSTGLKGQRQAPSSGVFRVSCGTTQRVELHWISWRLRSLECGSHGIQRPSWRSMMRLLRCWPRWGCVKKIHIQPRNWQDFFSPYFEWDEHPQFSQFLLRWALGTFMAFTKVMKRKKLELEELGA